jgi:hypothetical protein
MLLPQAYLQLLSDSLLPSASLLYSKAWHVLLCPCAADMLEMVHAATANT